MTSNVRMHPHVAIEVFSKKSQKTHKDVIERRQKRLNDYHRGS